MGLYQLLMGMKVPVPYLPFSKLGVEVGHGVGEDGGLDSLLGLCYICGLGATVFV